ncbi:zinc finger protein 112 [Fopius arisanus]|uniref:ZFP112_0 protein n=1 Tax=Fopius arisanus TaxID=64838 RepID=A0A0C9QMH4_9HYME|nr:PREDICTED: zinc finger protein 112-like [Fopius arisanus]
MDGMDLATVETTCRLCTDRGENYHAIFALNSHSIADKINNCLPIVISADDGLPLHICPACLNDLNTSYKLRERSLEADGFLRQQMTLILVESIKQEDKFESENEDINTKSLLCGICESIFEDAEAFDNHMEKYHASQWVCNLCGMDLKTSDNLLQHKHAKHYDSSDHLKNVKHFNSDVSEDPSDRDETIDIKDEDIPLSCRINPEKKDIPCDICGVIIETESFMAMHIKFHEPRSMHCSSCSRFFQSPYELFLHKQNVHKGFVDQKMKWFCEKCGRFGSNTRFIKKHQKCGKTRFKCKYCEVEFNRHKEFSIHQRKNHSEIMTTDPDVEKFKCPTCGKVFIEKDSYGCHLRVHRVRMERKYGCEKCDGSFLSPTQLKHHIDDIHVRRRDYKCSSCEKGFTSSRSLKAHEQRHISQTCQQCGEQFENIRILNKHLLEVHSISVPATGKHSCKECGKRFPKLRLLKDHRNIHSGKRPHVCDICKETFRTYAARWSHVQKHKNGAFYCDHCKRKFSTKGHVRRHLACHMPPEDWNYECKICNQKFQRKCHLETHSKKHNDTRPYQCDLCDARFLKDKFLLVHKKRCHAQP